MKTLTWKSDDRETTPEYIELKFSGREPSGPICNNCEYRMVEMRRYSSASDSLTEFALEGSRTIKTKTLTISYACPNCNAYARVETVHFYPQEWDK